MYEKYSVLFVDDEENILSSIRRGLMDVEYTCYFASSGKEALEIIKKQDIHVIVTDMRMPIMNGLELLKIVEEISPLTVKLVLSGYTQLPQILVTINQVDIFKFITKPWNLDELIGIVDKSIDYYILHEENAKYKKILETKNQAYQNILKKMDEVISNAKKSSEMLGICGKAILAFGKKFNLEDKLKYQSIFSMQDVIFEIISNAVTNETKEYTSDDLFLMIHELMVKEYPSIIIEKKSSIQNDLLIHNKIKVNAKMLEATISTIFIIFEEEFKTKGFFPNIETETKVKVSFIAPRVETDVIDHKSGLTVLDVKIDFIKEILKEVLSWCQIALQIAKINGSLVIGIMIEE